MSRSSSVDIGAQRVQLAWVFGLLATFWVVSDAGYYLLLPVLGFKASYNASPIVAAVYYGLWVAIALIAFWNLYRVLVGDL